MFFIKCSPSVSQAGAGWGWDTAEGFGGRSYLFSLRSSEEQVLTSINILISVKSLKTVKAYNVK